MVVERGSMGLIAKEKVIHPERDAINQYNIETIGLFPEDDAQVSLAFNSNPPPALSFDLMSSDPLRHL
jgi:hypothetical protein